MIVGYTTDSASGKVRMYILVKNIVSSWFAECAEERFIYAEFEI